MENRQHVNILDKIIQHKLNVTVKFLNNNLNIFLTRADKGRDTVALDLEVSNEKGEKALNDEKYY